MNSGPSVPLLPESEGQRGIPNWSEPGHVFGQVTVVGMSGTRSEQNYSYKTDFETRRENQDFRRQHTSLSRPPLDSTTFDTNTTNKTMSPMSPVDSIPVKTKAPDPAPLTLTKDSPTRPTNN